MNTITLHRVIDPSPVLAACRPRVYVAGRRDYRLEAVSVDWLAAPEFGEARIAAVRGAHQTRPPRAQELLSIPAVGQRVTVRNPIGQADWEFRGAVVGHEVILDGGSERLTARLTHAMADALSGPVQGRTFWDGWELHQQIHERTRFNAGDGTLASAQTHEVNGRGVRVFSTEADAVRWTVADALAYLLAVHGRGVPVAAAPATVEAADRVDLGSMDVSGQAARKAIAAMAQRAGLIVRAAREGSGVVIQPSGQGRPGRVRLAPVGGVASPATSNLWQAKIEIGRRPSRRGVVALGDVKRYEATFELSPGWSPYDTASTWGQTVRSRSDDWDGQADLLRRWVLNEDGAYSDAPWNLPVHDFSHVAAGDFTLAVPRRLGACLSTDPQGRSLGVVVEVSADAGASWRRWSGPVRIAAGRCDVILGGDELDGDYFRAAAAGEARVRVTATVASDARLVVEIEGNAGAGRQVVSASDAGRWARVSPASVFAETEGLGEPLEEDDTERLEAIARRHVEASSGVEAKLTLAWCEPAWAVGDVVGEVGGRGLSLFSAPGVHPQVTRVRHEFEDSQRTILTVR